MNYSDGILCDGNTHQPRSVAEHHRNQPSETKPALYYEPLLSLQNLFKMIELINICVNQKASTHASSYGMCKNIDT